MAERGWALESRLAGLFLAFSWVLTGVLGGGGAWRVHEGFEERVVELLVEEHRECALPLEEDHMDLDAFRAHAARMDRINPDYGLTFAFRPAGSEAWTWSGAPLEAALREEILGLGVPGEGELDHARWWRATHLPADDVGRSPGDLLATVDARRARASVADSMVQIAEVAGLFLLGSLGVALLLRRLVRRQFQVLGRTCQALALGVEPAGEVGGDVPREVGTLVGQLGRLLDAVRTENERGMVLISGIAHEVRTPLQVLQTEVDLARVRERSAEEYRGVLDSIQGELAELNRQVENIMMLAARSTRALMGEREEFDLGYEAGTRLRAGAHAGRIAFTTDGDTRMHGDRELVLLALVNLVWNGLQYSPPGTPVRVCVVGTGRTVELHVEDEGPGIPPEDRARVFEADARLDRERAGGGRGSGLGLAIVRRCVRVHGGTVEILDATVGTHVRVRLPRANGRDGGGGITAV